MLKTLTIGALALGLSGTAHAQSSLQDLFEVAPEKNETYIDIGGGVLTAPAYLGSDDQDVYVLPYANGVYKGRFFADPTRGIGVHAINKTNFQLSAFGSWVRGRDGDDTPIVEEDGDVFTALGPMGEALVTEAQFDNLENAFEVDTTFTASADARYRFKYGLIDLRGDIPIGDVDGFRSTLTVTSKIPYEPAGLEIYPGVRGVYTTSGWNNSYYGIDADQAAASGLAEFDADGDVSTLGAFVLTRWTIPNGRGFQLVGVANYDFLTGDPEDSPLSPDDEAFSGAIGVAKRF